MHKANIMKYTEGLWLRVAQDVAKEFPDIEFDDRIVDNMAMQLVQKPELYDVMVMPNLFGDILSDLCAGLVGGLGLAPGANTGDEIALFEATHGSAPKYAGKNVANPMAMMLSGMMMLRHIGEKDAGDRLEAAIAAVIAEGSERHLRHEAEPRRPHRRRHLAGRRRDHRRAAEGARRALTWTSPDGWCACARSASTTPRASQRSSPTRASSPGWRSGRMRRTPSSRRSSGSRRRLPDELHWAIECIDDGAFLGTTGFHGIDHRNRHCGWGIWTGPPDRWGHGYGTEACMLSVEYAFRVPGDGEGVAVRVPGQ